MPSFKSHIALLRVSALFLVMALPVAAVAGPITYTVNQPIGSGSVVGTIQTDGSIGTLSKTNILSWDLILNGAGASTTLSSAGGSSLLLLVGGDVSATKNYIYFNYSGTDAGYLAFQAANPGLYSGSKYTCNNTTWSGCSLGASVVPQSYSNSSAIYDATYTGLQIYATAGPTISDDDLLNSILALAGGRTSQLLINQLGSELLLGRNEQVSCGNCGGAGASFGSFSLSAHGRRALSPEWTILGGMQAGTYESKGANVDLNVGFAVGLQFDPIGLGSSRPYAEVDVSASMQDTHYSRRYPGGMGSGKARNYDLAVSAKAGWVNRLSPRDEAAAYVGYTRMSQYVGGYAENIGEINPINASLPKGTDVVQVASLNGQYTHLFGRRIEADLNGGVNWAFSSHSGLRADFGNLGVVNVSGARPAFVYYEAGGRLGVRLSGRLTLDLFANAILAPRSIGSSAHGGFGVRWQF